MNPNAIASARHSRRNANHSKPIPGVTFVSRTNDQVAGHWKPLTIASASRIWMLPALISEATGTVKRTKIVKGPAR